MGEVVKKTIDLDALAARLGPKERAAEANLRVRWSRSRRQQSARTPIAVAP